jgi:serine protease Do
MNRQKLSSVNLIMLGILIGALFAVNFNPNLISNMFANDSIGAASAPVKISPLAKQLNETFTSVSQAVLPTVVSINVKIESKQTSKNNGNNPLEGFGDFFGFSPFGQQEQGPTEASGSGVVLTSNGYIVTNNHVVEDAVDIKVTLYNKKTYKAKLIGNDPMTDLAVIKIEESNLTPAFLANIDDIKLGEMVLAIGNPMGLNSTITQGIISSIGRGQLSLNRKNGEQTIENYIQTDAAINPGNSGGGLFDLNGSLVGINTAIATRTGTFIGYGFAIPIDLVKAIAMDLIDDGKIDRGYIGVKIQSVDEAMAKAVGLDKVIGVTIQEVNKKGPADKAGLEIGDIILEVDGKEVKTSNELQGFIFTKRSGESVNLTLWRDGKKISKKVTLEPLDGKTVSTDEAQKGSEPDIDNNSYEINLKTLGITVEKLTSDKKDDYGVDYGVLINKVERGSLAAEKGLAPGTIIQKADRQKIETPYDLNKIIKNKKPGDAILLQVKYKNLSRMEAIIIPEE